jgi:Lrp/AsnC family leucine-responsive transcriptional regulator
MAVDRLLDDIGLKILSALQGNARTSFSELGRIVGLSSPAVAERVHRMEEAGYIKEYRAVVDHGRIGLPVMAFISVIADIGKLTELDELARSLPEVVEGFHLSGSDDLLIKVIAASMSHLELIINQIGNYGETTTSIVLSSPVTRRSITPLIRDTEG